MKIRFTQKVDLELIVGIVDDTPMMVPETFNPGDETEIDICDGLVPPFAREIQFGDGSCAYVETDFWKCVEIYM